MNHFSAGLLGLLLAPGWALAATGGGGTSQGPTRLQLCQQEVQGAAAEERKRMLRECLVRRVEGEAGVAAECRRQLRLGASRSAAQQRQLRDCETRALTVPSGQLPRRPAPPGGAGPATPRAVPPTPRPTPAARPLREGA